jgi:hypothetical protein
MNVKALRSEIERITRSLVEGMQGPEMILPSRVEAILTRLEERLYPAADSIQVTSLRREVLEDLDRIQLASERFLEGVDTAAIEECVAQALGTLSGVRSGTAATRLQDIVTEELIRARAQIPQRVRRQLREEPELQAGNVQKLANDSLDVALDSYFDKVGDTLDASGQANKEPNQDGEEGTQEFSAVDFASDIANLVDRTDTLLDLRGTIARRAVNHVTEKYGADAGENVKQVLSANFDIEVDSERDAQGQRDETRPAAIGAGGGSGGAAAGGGAGG